MRSSRSAAESAPAVPVELTPTAVVAMVTPPPRSALGEERGWGWDDRHRLTRKRTCLSNDGREEKCRNMADIAGTRFLFWHGTTAPEEDTRAPDLVGFIVSAVVEASVPGNVDLEKEARCTSLPFPSQCLSSKSKNVVSVSSSLHSIAPSPNPRTLISISAASIAATRTGMQSRGNEYSLTSPSEVPSSSSPSEIPPVFKPPTLQLEWTESEMLPDPEPPDLPGRTTGPGWNASHASLPTER
mmetsp:Transcript_46454/g.140713  ORF Transcript_46454/g.140713 Transcript_46454/m.140713 type:complete len:242 (-) Transcript_46454:574-1299(-)